MSSYADGSYGHVLIPMDQLDARSYPEISVGHILTQIDHWDTFLSRWISWALVIFPMNK
jgi:hypothetical protein